MIRKLSRSSLKLLVIGACYLLVTIAWIWISLQTNRFERESGWFEINALLKFKILLSASVLAGRLLFNQYRLSPPHPGIIAFGLFLVGWTVFDKLVSAVNLYYGFLIGADVIVWSLFISEITETMTAVFRFWKRLPKVNYAMFSDIWSKLSDDLLKLGIWLTALLGLTFFYLVNFFMIDALLYSRLLLIPLILIGTALYLLIFSKIKAWVNSDLIEIDNQLDAAIDWRQLKDDPELPQKTAWFQYLTLIRNYLKDLQKPVLLLKPCLLYILCTVLIWNLPYYFGRVIEL